MKPNEFKCYGCKKVFEKDWSEEEAREESLRLWGKIDPEEEAQICDDCFKKFMTKFN